MKSQKTLFILLPLFSVLGTAPLRAAAEDNFADATPVPALPASGTNENATLETNEPVHGGNAGGASVWWTWKPAADGVYVINTRGSGFDTLLAVYSGTAVNALTLIAGNNNISLAEPASEVFVRASAASTYHIAIDGANGDTGPIKLDIKPVAAADQAPNDNFTSAIHLGNSATVTRAGNNQRATREFNLTTLAQSEPNHNGQSTYASVWYSWTAPSNGLFVIDTRGSVINTTLAVYTGDTVAANAITYLASNNNLSTDAAEIAAEVLLSATANRIYRIAVDGANTNTNETSRGAFTLNIKPAAGAPPANDNFASAAAISGNLPISITASNLTATREVGEPFIVNALAAASLWWKWTPTAEVEVLIDTLGTGFDTLLGVYTGAALTQLTSIAANNNIDNTILQSRVSFIAKANTTYYISADGIAGTTQRRGDITLRVQVSPERTILPRGSTWEWLNPTDGANPNDANPNFNKSWFTKAYNNSPAFKAAAPGILGYGVINLAPGIATDIGLPEDVANRFTAYFRKAINLPTAVEGLRADILADDGAVIYIDGKEVKRVNMPDEPDTYTLGALNATGTEDSMLSVDLGALSAGEHLLAISMHNTVDAGGLGNSSDLGFDLRLYVPAKTVVGVVELTAEGVGTGFEEADLASTSYARGSNGNKEIGFTQTNRRVPVINLLNANDTVQARKSLRHNNAAGGNLTFTDSISVGNFTTIEASVLVHTFSASATNFEVADRLRVYVERSVNGQTWLALGDVIPEVMGLDTDDEDDITRLNKNQELNGDWNKFTSKPLPLPAGTKFVRMVIDSNNDSANEYMYFDDLLIKPVGAAPPPSALKVLSFSRSGANAQITWSSVAGTNYGIQFSPNLQSGSWTRVGTQAATGTTSNFTYAIPANANSRGFLRIVTPP